MHLITSSITDREEPFGKVIDAYLRKEIDLNSKQALHLAFSANRWERVRLMRLIRSTEKIRKTLSTVHNRLFPDELHSFRSGEGQLGDL